MGHGSADVLARRQRPPTLHSDHTFEDSVSRSWDYNTLSGSMTHKQSGIRVSPTNGIKCDGHDFTLKADDIMLDDIPLGRGSSGCVWRGSVKSTGMPVAVKTVRVDRKDDRKLLLNEVATLVKVEGCPNLVQWFAGFASQKKAGEVFLVLELMDGGSMTDIWNKHNGVPPAQLAAIARQVFHWVAPPALNETGAQRHQAWERVIQRERRDKGCRLWNHHGHAR